MRAELTEVVRLDWLLEKFGEFHKAITGTDMYTEDDPFWQFRVAIVFASGTGITGERKDTNETDEDSEDE